MGKGTISRKMRRRNNQRKFKKRKFGWWNKPLKLEGLRGNYEPSFIFNSVCEKAFLPLDEIINMPEGVIKQLRDNSFHEAYYDG